MSLWKKRIDAVLECHASALNLHSEELAKLTNKLFRHMDPAGLSWVERDRVNARKNDTELDEIARKELEEKAKP